MALGVQGRQCQGNLLGRPVPPQQATHHLEHRAIGVQLVLGASIAPALLAAMLGRDADVRHVRVWGALQRRLHGIARQLTADGAG